MTILIVDDNPTNVIIIREILKKENYLDICSSTSAKCMFEILGIDNHPNQVVPNKSNIDLILLDMMMPEMDGIEACRVIQHYSHLRDIPIIMVTAVGDSKKLAEALDSGAVDYVTKPINKVELMARIRLALRLKKENDWHKERDQRIQEELRIAALVQNAVLTSPIEDDLFEVHALYKPSAVLAGDLYAWYQLRDGRYGIIVLDMMGHGISSSLVCMFIASVLKDTITTYVEPEKVIQELNRRLYQLYIENELIQYYFTAIYLVVDTRKKRVDYVNAGHPPALFFQGNESAVMLHQVCYPVGLFDTIEVQQKSFNYDGDSHIALYTDGLMEIVAGDYDAQMAYLISYFEGNHEWDEGMMQQAFFNIELQQVRDDDKCLVWISLKEGGSPE
ncbi:fused response regulator/phosphatase [Paenibacillus crassostreae]|uniref:Response regulator n=1 Tax=Paenibacillus crassostreae TaxID=1763538 RepID=A0A167EWV4_9BACL|nr:fused response regulator/phosphatase [Paenibacillus crassostreae]AOZ94743.1 response regulator [Paenibacillus crassostreae]OAB75954.1 response regulator [Paenibacillus crassostreae]